MINFHSKSLRSRIILGTRNKNWFFWRPHLQFSVYIDTGYCIKLRVWCTFGATSMPINIDFSPIPVVRFFPGFYLFYIHTFGCGNMQKNLCCNLFDVKIFFNLTTWLLYKSIIFMVQIILWMMYFSFFLLKSKFLILCI